MMSSTTPSVTIRKPMAGPAAASDKGNRIIPSYTRRSTVAVAVDARTLVSLDAALHLTLNRQPGIARALRLPSPGVALPQYRGRMGARDVCH